MTFSRRHVVAVLAAQNLNESERLAIARSVGEAARRPGRTYVVEDALASDGAFPPPGELDQEPPEPPRTDMLVTQSFSKEHVVEVRGLSAMPACLVTMPYEVLVVVGPLAEAPKLPQILQTLHERAQSDMETDNEGGYATLPGSHEHVAGLYRTLFARADVPWPSLLRELAAVMDSGDRTALGATQAWLLRTIYARDMDAADVDADADAMEDVEASMARVSMALAPTLETALALAEDRVPADLAREGRKLALPGGRVPVVKLTAKRVFLFSDGTANAGETGECTER